MTNYGPGFIQFGPNDVTHVNLTFWIEGVGNIQFSIHAEEMMERKFVRKLYKKVMDTFGTGGTHQTEFGASM